MKSIAIGTLKGGCGKTNTVFNTISMLAKERYKILAVDCDAQANLTSSFNFGYTIDEYDYLGTIFEKMFSNRDISPVNVVVKRPLDFMPTVDLLPSHIYLTSVEMQIISKAGREFLLKKYIERHKSFFDQYDYLIFDTAPNLMVINQNAFLFSDEIILVADMDISALMGALKFNTEWANITNDLNIENKISGLIINKYDKRMRLSKEVVEYARDNEILKELSFDTIIPQNVKLQETSMMKTPIAYYDVKNAGYEAYVELINELKEKEVL